MENWKDIVGYEEYYQVNDLGNVKSIDRITKHGRKRKEQLLKLDKSRTYYSVGLWKDGVCHKHSVHRLVAKAFIPNPDGKPQVNHINENKLDNRASNLNWMTASENANHGTCVARSSSKRSKRVSNGIETFESISEAERQTGVSNPNIVKCCKGIRKSAGGYKWSYVT